jgi:ribonuclease III
MAEPVDLLLERLGIDRAASRLEDALTHSSYVNEHPGIADYERLEFLGDAVLGLCVSEMLLQHVPRATEGKLTRMRAALVNTEALANFARDIDLVRFIRLGRGAVASGDATHSKVLADVVEAIVAACYLDSGLELARVVTRRIVGDRIGVSDRLAARDPKSRLQEQAQRGGRSAPVYRVVASEGPDHDRSFEVEVQVDGNVLARGRGRTKKLAEREAARMALAGLRCEPEEST